VSSSVPDKTYPSNKKMNLQDVFNAGKASLLNASSLVSDLIYSAPRQTNDLLQRSLEGKQMQKRQSADTKLPPQTLIFMHEQQEHLTQRAKSKKLEGTTSGSTLNSEAQPTYLLPLEQPLRKRGKKTLVLDLDETLVHSQFKPVSNADFVLTINISNLPNQVMN